MLHECLHMLLTGCKGEEEEKEEGEKEEGEGRGRRVGDERERRER